MGRRRDLTTIEKTQIVKLLFNQKTTIERARMLSREHRTIKNFVFFFEVTEATLE